MKIRHHRIGLRADANNPFLSAGSALHVRTNNRQNTKDNRERMKPWICRLLAITALGSCFLTSWGMTQPSNAAAVKTGTPAPGTQIVDSTGAVIGNFCGFGCVTRNVNGVWLVLRDSVSRDGLITEPPDFVGISNAILYTSSNCSGAVYLDASSIPINGYMVGQVSGGVHTTATIYYPATPYQSLLISSSNNGGACQVANPPFMVDAGVATTTPLTVVPPLSIQ